MDNDDLLGTIRKLNEQLALDQEEARRAAGRVVSDSLAQSLKSTPAFTRITESINESALRALDTSGLRESLKLERTQAVWKLALEISTPRFAAELPNISGLAQQHALAFPSIKRIADEAATSVKSALEFRPSPQLRESLKAVELMIPRDLAALVTSHPIMADVGTFARAQQLVTGDLFPNTGRAEALVRDVAALAIEPDATIALAAEAVDVDPDEVDGFVAVWLVVSDMSPKERRNLAIAVGALMVAIYLYVIALAGDDEMTTQFGRTIAVFVGLYAVYSAFLTGIESFGREDGR